MIKKNIQAILLGLTVVLIISITSCDPSKKYEKEEKVKIQEYLSNNPSLNFELKTSGLYYLEVEPGSGLGPVTLDSAFVRYTGKLLDGTIFDSNVTTGRPLYDFIVGENITGFDEGILLMKEGGKSIFLLPSELAYGASGSYPYIRGYTPLLFEVELVKVKAAPVK